MAFIVVYAACVLFPAPLRDLLIRVARAGVVQAHWSDDILDESFRSILRERPELAPEALERTRTLMNTALPDARVTGYERLVDSLELPDPDDRHVLAAAVRIGAQAIVTFNLKDFPATALEPLGIEAKHPDDQCWRFPRTCARTLRRRRMPRAKRFDAMRAARCGLEAPGRRRADAPLAAASR